MKIEEAKKIILSYIDRYEYVNKSVRYDENGYKATLEKHIEAFNTVIGDLHAMQNLLDEKNDELEYLQKENEELKNMDLTTVYLKGVSDEKERWRNKIRKKIKEYKNIFDMGEEWYTKQYIIEVLEELLK